jgi:hypothetical protein
MLTNEDGTIALRAWRGKYVAIGSEKKLFADRNSIIDKGHFQIVDRGGHKIALRDTKNNQYISVPRVDGAVTHFTALAANSYSAGVWETFEIDTLKKRTLKIKRIEGFPGAPTMFAGPKKCACKLIIDGDGEVQTTFETELEPGEVWTLPDNSGQTTFETELEPSEVWTLPDNSYLFWARANVSFMILMPPLVEGPWTPFGETVAITPALVDNATGIFASAHPSFRVCYSVIETPAPFTILHVQSDLNLHEGPGTNYKLITVLPKGTEVMLRGTVMTLPDGSQWGWIQAGANIGWLNLKFLN